MAGLGRGRRRGQDGSGCYWPGVVDAMAHLLLVITFLLGPAAEENLRRGLLINEGDWLATLFSSPLAIGLAIGAVFLTYLSGRVRLLERVNRMRDDVHDD